MHGGAEGESDDAALGFAVYIPDGDASQSPGLRREAATPGLASVGGSNPTGVVSKVPVALLAREKSRHVGSSPWMGREETPIASRGRSVYKAGCVSPA